METPHPHRKTPRRTFVIWALGCAGVSALLLPSWLKQRALAARTHAVVAEIAQLEEQIAQLAEEREKLQSDPTYLERIARQEFRATREGEILLKIEDAADGPTP